ncbi:MAG TPA: glycosyltransferase, partial [Roseimicrobium sp.]|nr:glycosyltransferase [Roseimicrobium sp.]
RARELGFQWAACLDGDGQHFPSDLTALFEVAEREHADLVVGNRMQIPESIPWLRRQVNRWMSRRLSKLAGRDLPDTQSGLRLMCLDAWHGLPIRAEGFEVESDVLLAFIRAGHKVSFAPVGVRYGQEQSKIRPVYDTVRWFRWWMRVRR